MLSGSGPFGALWPWNISQTIGVSGMYVLRLGPVIYDGWRDGTPFTLVDCFRECRGVGHATILTRTGRVVLRDAGSLYVRAHLRGGAR